MTDETIDTLWAKINDNGDSPIGWFVFAGRTATGKISSLGSEPF